MSNTALSPAALAVLAAAVCEGRAVRLTSGTLERALYEEIDTVLTRLGGKWKGGKVGAHQFTHYDPAPLVAGVVASGVMPPANPTAFFPTPAQVVAEMLAAVELPDLATMDAELWAFLEADRGGPFRVLEPSAGTGALADAIRACVPRVQVDCVECLPVNAAVLRAKGHRVVEADFLSFTSEERYDYVVMNPPFSVEGARDTYIDHIERAWSMLREGGRLVAIVPQGLRTRGTGRVSTFRNFVYEYGDAFDIEAGAFAESGTGIATTMLVLRKDAVTRRPTQGYHCQHCWETALVAENNANYAQTLDTLLTSGLTAEALNAAVDSHFDRVVATERLSVALLPACRAALRADAMRHRADLIGEDVTAEPTVADAPEAPEAPDVELVAPAQRMAATAVQGSLFDALAA